MMWRIQTRSADFHVLKRSGREIKTALWLNYHRYPDRYCQAFVSGAIVERPPTLEGCLGKTNLRTLGLSQRRDKQKSTANHVHFLFFPARQQKYFNQPAILIQATHTNKSCNAACAKIKTTTFDAVAQINVLLGKTAVLVLLLRPHQTIPHVVKSIDGPTQTGS